MPATALIKLTQGAIVGDGQAIIGVLGTPVNIENSDNTGIQSWQIDLVFVPFGSSTPALSPLTFSDSGSTPFGTITPDTRGSYRFVLKVWGVPNRIGVPNVDIRVFSIPEAGRGLIVPPVQTFPYPLPPPESGDPLAKPDEMNFSSREFGWAGNSPTGGLLDYLIKTVDTMSTFAPVGTPNDGDIIAWSTALNEWVVTSRTQFSITAFAATVSLVETGVTVVSPAFTAAESAVPDTLLLTNNFNSESKDVHATPTSFASSTSRAMSSPGLAWTFTLSGTKSGNLPSSRTASITSAQRSYAGIVAFGAAPATLIAAATFNSLTNSRAISFVLTDNGTRQGQFYYPTRYGTPATVKDRSTGFGIAFVLLGTFSQTNVQGFIENYNQYGFVSSFNGTITVDVT